MKFAGFALVRLGVADAGVRHPGFTALNCLVLFAAGRRRLLTHRYEL